MGILEILIIVALIAAMFAFRVVRTKPKRKPDVIIYMADHEALAHPDVQLAIARGRKIEAIKAYRELTGHGLKDAKEAVEYAIDHPEQIGKQKKPQQAAGVDNQAHGIKQMIREGRLEEAVETYREFMGVDPYTAQEAIEEMAKGL